MRTHHLRHVIFVSLIAALTLVTGVRGITAAPSGTHSFSNTTSREDILVQECAGFDAVTSYTVSRDSRFVTDPNGDLVFERRHVRFSGSFANSATGRAMPYDGGFTRIADYEQGQIVIADLAVHLDLPGAGVLTYAVERRDGDLIDEPLAVLREFASHPTTVALCGLLTDFPDDNPIGPLDLLQPASNAADPASTVPLADICEIERPRRRC